MRYRQRKVVDAGHRIQVYLDTNKDRVGPVDEGNARGVLDEVITNLEALGDEQDPTRSLRRRELQEEKNAKYDLREVHMRPIDTIAEVSLRDVPEFDRLRLPIQRLDLSQHIQWARGMAKAAEPHQAVFVKHGLAQDFIAKLLASADGAKKAMNQRWSAHTSRVGATAKLQSETRRALGVFDVIDSLVAPKVRSDDQLSKDWELTKHVATKAAKAALAEIASEAPEKAPPGEAPATPAPVTPTPNTPAATTPAPAVSEPTTSTTSKRGKEAA
jgi:hypothetical protein